mmetsp:Transcript_14745/g.34526  ORF Transcript_14745/g.34526 Transcript_14745/m.34526 type:complete len:215 (-) Transcript_14745:285-929(-)
MVGVVSKLNQIELRATARGASGLVGAASHGGLELDLEFASAGDGIDSRVEHLLQGPDAEGALFCERRHTALTVDVGSGPPRLLQAGSLDNIGTVVSCPLDQNETTIGLGCQEVTPFKLAIAVRRLVRVMYRGGGLMAGPGDESTRVDLLGDRRNKAELNFADSLLVVLRREDRHNLAGGAVLSEKDGVLPNFFGAEKVASFDLGHVQPEVQIGS